MMNYHFNYLLINISKSFSLMVILVGLNFKDLIVFNIGGQNENSMSYFNIFPIFKKMKYFFTSNTPHADI